ncbi:hypothetical protein EDD29_0058 [Actinocorallia herbida]|uniref:Uncharacterized protein n=1 Tax=Actinocorallia herbida TaxID=58109 RepID=A0A3N1CPC9_9ACTN|nr:hypothetical protein [Actinocorallia herbida]ROO82578.1 hypothetical protein EDD29_0058 [Actinocorallia herbida]
MAIRMIPCRNTKTGAFAELPETALKHFADYEPLPAESPADEPSAEASATSPELPAEAPAPAVPDKPAKPTQAASPAKKDKE